MGRVGSGNRTLRRGRTTRWLIAALAITTVQLAAAQTAMAWKPFAHNYIGDQAYRDAVDDGRVTIGNHEYPLDHALYVALKRSRPYYNAGVVGPDGFPDLVYGQSQIHPEQTGKWLSFLVDKAWAAQKKRGPGYATEEERGRILAFTYGYLTHAAGDMWGHTLINDFAGGVFPAVADFIGGPDPKTAARIALRHVVAEAYAGAATPGWDRSRARATVCRGPSPPGTRCTDVSDDQTHGIEYAVPNQFIYDTLVNPAMRLPVGRCGDGVDDDHDGTKDDGCPGQAYTVGDAPEPQRGALLDYFIDMEADLAIQAAKRRFDAKECAANASACRRGTRELTVPTVRGDKHLRIPSSRCESGKPCTTSTADGSISLVASYLDAWIEDIQSGLKDWSRFGLAITKALFDPQAHRDAQNAECAGHGSETRKVSGVETNLSRARCEAGVGAIDTIVYKTNGYAYDHLFSMLGAPDAGVSILKFFGSAVDVFRDVFDKIVGPALNPLRNLKVTVEEAIKDVVKTKIRDATGIDPDQLAGFLKSPGRWMCGDAGVSITLPKAGRITAAGLFSDAEHKRLDAIMGLPPNHHETGTTLRQDCSPLKSGSAYNFDPNKFAPMKNSITQAKLLLLDGRELNSAFGNVLHDGGVIKSADQAQTYPINANVMFTPMTGTAPWLQLIDGDHAWRQDGRPRFTGSSGGNGQYPLWESCLLRPAFRLLFTDWENSADPVQTNFPDLGDPPSPDLSDRNTPGVVVRPADLSIPLLSTIVVPPGSRFVTSASDTVFTDSAIQLSWKLYRPGADPNSVPSQPVANGGSFTLPASAMGDWIVEVTAADGCGSRPRTQRVQII